ncbi:MAG: TPM domain-containing protein [Bacteroidetes bacterium]|nr:TPM domain-containing protein [Bacteroidota bacterium]
MSKFLSIILVFIFISNGISAQPEYPDLKNYATDLSSTLSSSQINQLNNDLKKFDDATTSQIVFLMINSLDGYPIEMYANELAEKNKIGTKGNDNGILFIVSVKDRKMRIEVGYGLEGALPDALASSILRNEVKPYFKRDMYYEGVRSGLIAVMKATVGEYTRDQKEENNDEKGKGISGYFIFIVLFLILKLFGRGRGGGIGSAILLGGMLGGMGGRSGGGGGFSGGGGSFGGGGASGSW